MRFSRRALEIKVLDIQECVRADIAIAVFIRAVLRHLVRRLQDGSLVLPPHDMLVDDLSSSIREGTQARVHARHLRSPDLARQDQTTARSVLGSLLDVAHTEVTADEREYLGLVEDRIRRGSLSERILHQLRRRSRRRAADPPAVIREIYEELIDCLEANRPWDG
jgi:carboxylate-amine ligase